MTMSINIYFLYTLLETFESNWESMHVRRFPVSNRRAFQSMLYFRAIGFMYKGMNQEELKKFYAAQKEQMAAAKVVYFYFVLNNFFETPD